VLWASVVRYPPVRSAHFFFAVLRISFTFRSIYRYTSTYVSLVCANLHGSFHSPRPLFACFGHPQGTYVCMYCLPAHLILIDLIGLIFREECKICTHCVIILALLLLLLFQAQIFSLLSTLFPEILRYVLSFGLETKFRTNMKQHLSFCIVYFNFHVFR
jgi:hypothetical protein